MKEMKYLFLAIDVWAGRAESVHFSLLTKMEF